MQHTLTKSKPSLRRAVMTLSVDEMEYLFVPRAPEERTSARSTNATTSPTSTWYIHHQQRHPRAGTSLRHVRRKLPLALQQALESIRLQDRHVRRRWRLPCRATKALPRSVRRAGCCRSGTTRLLELPGTCDWAGVRVGARERREQFLGMPSRKKFVVQAEDVLYTIRTNIRCVCASSLVVASIG